MAIGTTPVPALVITDAGLAAASVAKPDGPYIEIVSFEIGDGYGYDPQETDTGLNGNVLYTGTPTSYTFIDDNTLDIQLLIPPNAGPWLFGEVALFLPGNVMFAKAVFETPQQKYSSLNTNVVNTFTFHCLLRLKQATAIMQVTVDETPGILPLQVWSDVVPQSQVANVEVPAYLIGELSPAGDSSLITKSAANQWTVPGGPYYVYKNAHNNANTFSVASATSGAIQIAASSLMPQDLTTANRRFVIRTAAGYFRSVLSVVTAGSNYQFNLNVSNDGTYANSPLPVIPSAGQQVTIYRDDMAANGRLYYEQIIDPPSIPNATVGTPGLAYGGSGLYMPSPGVITATGLLHSPSTNTGRMLTSADDLNNMNLPSGVYSTDAGGYGTPANFPSGSIDGHIYYVNTSASTGSASQLYVPFNIENTSAVMYYRGWNSASGQWGPWKPVGGSNGVTAQNGYVEFGNLIMQWFVTPSIVTDQVYTGNFPIAFPTQAFGVVVTQQFTGITSHAQYSLGGQAISTSQYTASPDQAPPSGSTVFGIALGM